MLIKTDATGYLLKASQGDPISPEWEVAGRRGRNVIRYQ
jgi:hypothetical protein